GEIFGCPIPTCGAERRHPKRKDKRGAIGIGKHGKGWQCHQCGTKGGHLDLIAYCLCGDRYSESTRDEVREWCKRFLGMDASPGRARPQHLRATPATSEPEPESKYPPNVEKLWEACIPVTNDNEVSAWLGSRDHDPQTIADLSLARVLPRETMELP